MKPTIEHLHTYFLFPFSIDHRAVVEDHPAIWRQNQTWFGNLDTCVTAHVGTAHALIATVLGGWRRTRLERFDISSPAYQDMVFFHPFVRRSFFDTGLQSGDHEVLLHSYSIEPPAGSRLYYEGEDTNGCSAKVEITDLVLQLFANGIGILKIGVQALDVPFSQALWINEMMRKIYPSSDRQVASGRIPKRLAFVLEKDGTTRVVVEERFEKSQLVSFRPQLSEIVLSLLSFADYEGEEFESLLDERMIVESFICLRLDDLPPGIESSEDFEMVISRFLYVDLDGEGYRYQREFIRKEMQKHVYRRWQHQGTVYGMTGYSNITITPSLSTSGSDRNRELVHRMFLPRTISSRQLRYSTGPRFLILPEGQPRYRASFFPFFQVRW
jgi:hypothetical protein